MIGMSLLPALPQLRDVDEGRQEVQHCGGLQVLAPRQHSVNGLSETVPARLVYQQAEEVGSEGLDQTVLVGLENWYKLVLQVRAGCDHAGIKKGLRRSN